MAEKKKVQLFPVDTSAFSKEEVAKAQSASSKRKKKTLTIEQLIAAAKDLGVSIYIPNSVEEEKAQKQSLDKLGFITETEPKIKETFEPQELTGTLNFRHIINGTSYGPGNITFSYLDKEFFNSLLKQDQQASIALRDTAEYSSGTKAYIIELGTGNDQFHKYRKREVPFDQLSEIMAITNGIDVRVDAARYRGNNNSDLF